MWDLIVSVPDHCLSFYLKKNMLCVCYYVTCLLIMSYHHNYNSSTESRFDQSIHEC